MNGLENLCDTLEEGSNEVQIDPQIIEKAMVPLQRMLDFSVEIKTPIKGDA